MTRTPKHDLAFEGSGQGLKDNLNDFLKVFDSLSHPLVLDRNLSAPPASPAQGATYIVGASATGAWAGKENNLALHYYGRWFFVAPWKGVTAYVDDEAAEVRWEGSAWTALASVPFALVTIDDDAVQAVTPPQIGGIASVVVQPNNAFPVGPACGLIIYDVGTSTQIIRLASGGTLDVINTAVTGTTGTDGRVTIGAADGQVQIENRQGGPREFLVKWI